MMKEDMRAGVIYHSGCIVETESEYYIFDYWKGEFPKLDSHKKIWVFFSHSHEDHYNPKVISMIMDMGFSPERIAVIISDDISLKALRKITDERVEIIQMRAHETIMPEEGITVETLKSNDLGVAYIVTTPYGTIYHGGDLHEWYWEGEPDEENEFLVEAFRQEINLIAGRKFDISFTPLDPRQENDYARGMLFFLSKVKSKKVFPIHYEGDSEIVDKFIREYPQYRHMIAKEKY